MLISRIDTLVIPIFHLYTIWSFSRDTNITSTVRFPAIGWVHVQLILVRPLTTQRQKSPPRSLASQVRLLVRRVALIVVIHIGESFTLIR
jgi:hypothetical protein